MKIGNDVGVQSYCYRGFKENTKVAQLVKECGLSKIEVCAVHVDFSDAAARAACIADYRNAGVEIVASGVNRIGSDAAAARPLFDFLKESGAKFMSVDFPLREVPECLRTAEALAEEYDVRLAIHNHGGRHWLGGSDALAWVMEQSSERIGLCLDTAWALDSREDPVAMVERFGDRMYGVHIKDFVFDRAREPEDVIVGTGNLDLDAFDAALAKVGFSGYAVLEYEGDVENPVPALTECVTAIR